MRQRVLYAVLVISLLLAQAHAGTAATAVTVAFEPRPGQDATRRANAVAAVAKVVSALNATTNPGRYVAWQLDGAGNVVQNSCPTVKCTATADIVVLYDFAADGTLTFWPTRKDSAVFSAVVVSQGEAASPTADTLRRIIAVPMAAQGDISLGVMFFPPAIVGSADTNKVKTFLGQLVSQMNSTRHVYTVWRIGPDGTTQQGDCPADRTSSCQVTNARILIRTTASPQEIDFTAFDALNGHAIGTHPIMVDTTKDIPPATITDDLMNSLLGTASVVNGNVLAVNHGFEQYIELVPETPASANDPDFGYYLEQMLRERGISAFRSQFTTVSLNGASDDAICSAGQRYLVYSVSVENDTKKILGHTRLSATSTGTLLDCVGRQSLSMSGQRRINVPTTATSLGLYSTLLLTLYSKFGTRFATFVPAFGAVVDADPTSVNTRGVAAAQALQRMVDNLCAKLPLPTPPPVTVVAAAPGQQPPPPLRSPGAPPRPLPGTAPTQAGPAAAPAGGAPALAFNPGPITGATPYTPRCTDPRLSRRSYDPVHGVWTRGWFGVEPSPTPTPAPAATP